MHTLKLQYFESLAAT